MNIWEAMLWGALQGLTEFLPVSSSGHLVLVPWLVGRYPPSVTFDVLVHMATLLAILFYFRGDILLLLQGVLDLVRERRLATPEARLVWLIALSAIPAVVLGVALREMVDRLFGTPPAAAALLLVTGSVMFLAERISPQQRSIPEMGARDALAMGVAQGLALAPGISRSGATLAMGLARGLRRTEAARFSFLMAIPVVLGATMLEVVKWVGEHNTVESALVIVAGFVAALLAGYMAIAVLLKHLRRGSLAPFAYYCWAFGGISLLIFVLRSL